MYMDKGEIYRSYKSAKNPNTQIGILAELNGCSKDDIVKIIKSFEIKSKVTKEENRNISFADFIYNKLDELENDMKILSEKIKEKETEYQKYSLALMVFGEYKDKEVQN